jgi:hypothetical protein
MTTEQIKERIIRSIARSMEVGGSKLRPRRFDWRIFLLTALAKCVDGVYGWVSGERVILSQKLTEHKTDPITKLLTFVLEL